MTQEEGASSERAPPAAAAAGIVCGASVPSPTPHYPALSITPKVKKACDPDACSSQDGLVGYEKGPHVWTTALRGWRRLPFLLYAMHRSVVMPPTPLTPSRTPPTSQHRGSRVSRSSRSHVVHAPAPAVRLGRGPGHPQRGTVRPSISFVRPSVCQSCSSQACKRGLGYDV
jgi:hypothetical protein